jgi:hypothetical protein
MNIREKLNDYVSRIPVVGDVLTTEVSAKGLGMIALGATLAFGAPSYAAAEMPTKPAHGAVEVMAGQETGTLDAKFAIPVAPKLNAFTRHRVTSDYDGNVGSFHVANLSYNVVDGLSVVAEVDAIPGVGLDPRLGAQYFKKVGDVSMFGLVSQSAKPDGLNLTSLTNVCYTPTLKGDLSLVLGVENVSNFNDEGHNFSTQRLRAGVGYKGLQGGIAADLTEVGKDPKFGYNAGGFVRKTF